MFCKPLSKFFEETKTVILKKEEQELEKLIKLLHIMVKYFLDVKLLIIEDPKLSKIISIPYFSPSKTAQNSLNFLTSKNTGMLITEVHPDVVALFKIIYVIINQEYEDYEDNELIKVLFNVIIPKTKATCLSEFYLIKKVFL